MIARAYDRNANQEKAMGANEPKTVKTGDELSDAAKGLLGSVFWMMPIGSEGLIFHTPSRISDQAKAALEELVAAGFVEEDRHTYRGGVRYSPKVNCFEFWGWVGRNLDNPAICFPLTKPTTPT
jgi:hypothetical protein